MTRTQREGGKIRKRRQWVTSKLDPLHTCRRNRRWLSVLNRGDLHFCARGSLLRDMWRSLPGSGKAKRAVAMFTETSWTDRRLSEWALGPRNKLTKRIRHTGLVVVASPAEHSGGHLVRANWQLHSAGWEADCVESVLTGPLQSSWNYYRVHIFKGQWQPTATQR